MPTNTEDPTMPMVCRRTASAVLSFPKYPDPAKAGTTNAQPGKQICVNMNTLYHLCVTA